MDQLTIDIQKYLMEQHKLHCGCYDGRKLSKIKDIVDPYDKNLKDAGTEGGEYFERMTMQGAYTEIIQIIDG